MKKSIIFGVLLVIVVSFASSFYFQHQAFTEQKSTMKSNFTKQQKKSDQQIETLQALNSDLAETIKTNEEKLNALQGELDSLKAEKDELIATNQELADLPAAQQDYAPIAQQEEVVAPIAEAPQVPTNSAGQTYQERAAELKSKLDNGELSGTDIATGVRMMNKILAEEFPQ